MQDIDIGTVVQLRWEPGTGGIVRGISGETVWVAIRNGEVIELPLSAVRRARRQSYTW